jgi:hypothetical protein
MSHIQKIWATIGKNWGKVAAVMLLLVTIFVVFYALNNNSDIDRKAQAITVQLSKRIGVPYNEAYLIAKSTLREAEKLPERGSFFENIWYGSPRARYLENTIETKLRRAGFSGFWLGSEVRAAVRSGLREAADRPQNKNK